ncbi:hypothetical protein [Leifsonia shinshuensis]|uniref:Uncharacterized protein n=1 Tax=Leifsonia shinshuensis TaxID=150026 RepID=A0A853CUT3_9MICO|nr:hypothetical protein [Leifsonia shinshuensis]NYJ24437.1 hypothetical protein [Leifsonia shinshuensis]
MTDLGELADRIREGLSARGVRVMEAIFAAEPAISLDEESTTVDDLIELVSASFTPLATITTTRLDRDELEEAVEASAGPLDPEVIRIFDDQVGDVDTVGVYWIHGAVTLAYYAAADWRGRLNQLLVVNEIDRRERFDKERSAKEARTTHLVDQLEAHPEFRAASINTRRAVGSALVESLLDVDDEVLRSRVVARASIRAQDNAIATYMTLQGRFAELAAELAATDLWTSRGSRVADRDSAARSFLISEADGYGPTVHDVTALRVAADGIARSQRGTP